MATKVTLDEFLQGESRTKPGAKRPVRARRTTLAEFLQGEDQAGAPSNFVPFKAPPPPPPEPGLLRRAAGATGDAAVSFFSHPVVEKTLGAPTLHSPGTPETARALGDMLEGTARVAGQGLELAQRELGEAAVKGAALLQQGSPSPLVAMRSPQVEAVQKETREKLLETSRIMQGDTEARAQQMSESVPGMPAEMGRGAVRSVAQMAPLIPTGPAGMIAGAAVLEGSRADYEAQKLPADERAAYLTRAMAIEALPAAIFQRFAPGFEGIGKQGREALQQGTLEALRRAGIMTMQEVPEELITELGHAINESFSGVDLKALEPEELRNRAILTVGQTIMAAGVLNTPIVGGAMLREGKGELAPRPQPPAAPGAPPTPAAPPPTAPPSDLAPSGQMEIQLEQPEVAPTPATAEEMLAQAQQEVSGLGDTASAPPLTTTKVLATLEVAIRQPEIIAPVARAAEAKGLPTNLMLGILQAESSGDPNALSPKGAQGWFQFMPATAKEVAAKLGITGYDPANLEQQAPMAADYFAGLLKRHKGDVRKALEDWNYGMGNADMRRKNGVPMPKETQNFVARVIEASGYRAVAEASGQSEATIRDRELSQQLVAVEQIISKRVRSGEPAQGLFGEIAEEAEFLAAEQSSRRRGGMEPAQAPRPSGETEAVVEQARVAREAREAAEAEESAQRLTAAHAAVQAELAAEKATALIAAVARVEALAQERTALALKTASLSEEGELSNSERISAAESRIAALGREQKLAQAKLEEAAAESRALGNKVPAPRELVERLLDMKRPQVEALGQQLSRELTRRRISMNDPRVQAFQEVMPEFPLAQRLEEAPLGEVLPTEDVRAVDLEQTLKQLGLNQTERIEALRGFEEIGNAYPVETAQQIVIRAWQQARQKHGIEQRVVAALAEVGQGKDSSITGENPAARAPVEPATRPAQEGEGLPVPEWLTAHPDLAEGLREGRLAPKMVTMAAARRNFPDPDTDRRPIVAEYNADLARTPAFQEAFDRRAAEEMSEELEAKQRRTLRREGEELPIGLTDTELQPLKQRAREVLQRLDPTAIMYEDNDRVPSHFSDQLDSIAWAVPSLRSSHYILKNIVNYALMKGLDIETATTAIWAHETGIHLGLRELLTKGERTKLLRNIFSTKISDKENFEPIDALGDSEFKAYFREFQQRQEELTTYADQKENELYIAEEYLAFIGEKVIREEGLSPKQASVWQRFLEALKSVLTSLNFTSRSKIDLETVARSLIQGMLEKRGRLTREDPRRKSQRGAALNPAQAVLDLVNLMVKKAREVSDPAEKAAYQAKAQALLDHMKLEIAAGRMEWKPPPYAGDDAPASHDYIAPYEAGHPAKPLVKELEGEAAERIERGRTPYAYDEINPLSQYLFMEVHNDPRAIRMQQKVMLTEQQVHTVIKEDVLLIDHIRQEISKHASLGQRLASKVWKGRVQKLEEEVSSLARRLRKMTKEERAAQLAKEPLLTKIALRIHNLFDNVWLPAIKAGKRAAFRSELNDRQLTAFEDVVDRGATVEDAAKANKVSKDILQLRVDDYRKIDNWGLDDYITNIEAGHIYLWEEGIDAEGKPSRQLRAVAVDLAQAYEKAAEVKKASPGIQLTIGDDAPIFTSSAAGRLPRKRFAALAAKHDKALRKAAAGMDKHVRKELAGVLAGISADAMKKTGFQAVPKFAAPLQQREDVLMGEKNLFNVLEAYSYAVRTKLGFDPVVNEMNRLLENSPDLDPNSKQALLDHLNAAKGKYGLTDRAVDGFLQMMARTAAQVSKGRVQVFPAPFAASRYSARTRQVVGMGVLGFRPMAGVINMLTSVKNVNTDQGFKALSEGAKLMLDPAFRQKLNMQTWRMGMDIVTEVSGRQHTPQSWLNPMKWFAWPEPHTRALAMAAGYWAATERMGMSEEMAWGYAGNVVRNTNFFYSIASLPGVFRDPVARTILQFKPYLINDLRRLKNLSREQWRREIAGVLLLGGPRMALHYFVSIPILGAAFKALFAAGSPWDVEELDNWLAEIMGRSARGVLGGVIGADMTHSLAPAGMDRWEDYAGVTVSQVVKGIKAVQPIFWGEEGSGVVAQERGRDLPGQWFLALGNFLRAYDSMVSPDGWVRKDGDKLYKIGGAWDTALLAMGATPIGLEDNRRLVFQQQKRNAQEAATIDATLERAAREMRQSGKLSEQTQDLVTLLGISGEAIEARRVQQELPPRTRALLRTRAFRQGEAADLLLPEPRR